MHPVRTERRRQHRRRIRRIRAVGLAFFASGAGALAFEALWFHQAGLSFGNSVWASSLVLAAFMGGLAAGNWLAARYGDRIRDCVRVYAGLELVVAVIGVALVYALPALGSALAPISRALWDYPAADHAVRLLVAFILLLAPSTAIGMTLPLLVRAARSWDRNFGRVLGLLYGINTLGGVAGIVAVETWWLGALGIRGTAFVAGALDIAAAGLALWVARRQPTADARAASGKKRRHPKPERTKAAPAGDLPLTPIRPARPSTVGLSWLVVAFLVGFVILGLEVVWLRFLSLFLNDTPLAFSMVLALVLGGIALGGLLAAGWSGRSARAVAAAPVVAFCIGGLGVAGYFLYPNVLSGPLPARQDAATILTIAAPLVLPACIASGALFPLLGAGLRESVNADAAAVGRLTLFNTLGAGLGSLAAGFWFLPVLGMERSMLLLFALAGAGGAVLSLATEQALWRRYGGIFAFVAVLALFPAGMVEREYIRVSAQRWKRAGDEIVSVREGLTATLIHVVHEHDGEVLFDHIATNAYSMTTNGFIARRYMKLFVYLPAAIHPKVERALVVGFGIGNTAKALSDMPEVAQIDVVDVSADMLEESRQLALPLVPHPLDDPRTRVHIEDGRYFLQTTRTQYDLITGEPPPPIIAGVGNLYTRQYFELLRDRLAPGGIVSYWLPLSNITSQTAKAIVAAFCGAFADCSLWNASDLDLMLVGTRDASQRVGVERFVAQWDSPLSRKELATLGFEVPSQLGALFIGDAQYLEGLVGNVQPLTDDRPRRLQASASRAEGEQLLRRLQNPVECRTRFQHSLFVRQLFPEPVRRAALDWFEMQRLINDLISPHPQVARVTRTLHSVLRSSTLELPVLLLLGSSPDYQRALSHVRPTERTEPAWRRHVIAGLVAERDLAGALEASKNASTEELLLPDLPAYLSYAIGRGALSDTKRAGGPPRRRFE